MGWIPTVNPGEPILAENVPLAAEADGTAFRVAQQGGIEWHLGCHARSPGLSGRPQYDYAPCTKFISKVYLEDNKAPFKDVCVIFNGLDETPHNLSQHELFGFYDSVGRALARSGKLAILLPSPFHLNRCLVYNSDEAPSLSPDFTRPSNALMKAPWNLYVNHYQSFRELVSLCRAILPLAYSRGTEEQLKSVCGSASLISDDSRDSLREMVDPYANISLVGYSMGGLRVMTAFCYAWDLALRHGEEPLFTSCVAINSGGSFSSMNVPSWVDAGEWANMVRRLDLEHFSEELGKHFPEERGVFEDYAKMIRDITLGNALNIRRLEELDDSFTRRLLFILGGSDNIMQMSSLHRITPPGGLNIFHVAGVGHMFRHGEWGTHLGSMLDHVGNFIDASSKDAGKLTSQEIVEYISFVDWRLALLPWNSPHMYPEPGGPSSIAEAQQEFRKRGKEAAACVLNLLFSSSTPSREGSEEGQYDLLLERVEQQHADELIEQMNQFINSKLLIELKMRIQSGNCHPGLYGQVRRTLLLSWIISENKGLVRHWDGQFETDAELEDGLLSQEWVSEGVWLRARRKQLKALEAIQRKMLRAFRLTCRKSGIELPVSEKEPSQ